MVPLPFRAADEGHAAGQASACIAGQCPVIVVLAGELGIAADLALAAQRDARIARAELGPHEGSRDQVEIVLLAIAGHIDVVVVAAIDFEPGVQPRAGSGGARGRRRFRSVLRVRRRHQSADRHRKQRLQASGQLHFLTTPDNKAERLPALARSGSIQNIGAMHPSRNALPALARDLQVLGNRPNDRHKANVRFPSVRAQKRTVR